VTSALNPNILSALEVSRNSVSAQSDFADPYIGSKDVPVTSIIVRTTSLIEVVVPVAMLNDSPVTGLFKAMMLALATSPTQIYLLSPNQPLSWFFIGSI
jgi:hypothetical protein